MLSGALRSLLGLVLLVAAAGCALPVRPDLPRTTALADAGATPLATMLAPRLPHDGGSAFRLLPVASAAFDARLAMTEAATRTIDLQYYIFSGDDTGKRFLRELGEAAARGVRVRMLIDDLYSTGEDRLLADFASLPNVEVRLFNPFAGGRASTWTRYLGASFDFARVDRRMHNKLLIVDNAAAMAGGRNIANEYFMHARDSNFVDLDLFVAGPAVPELSQAFDRYWNSREAYPIGMLAATPDTAAARAEFKAFVADAQGPPPDELPPEYAHWGTLPAEIRSGRIGALTAGRAEVVADNPEKAELAASGQLDIADVHLDASGHLTEAAPTVTLTVLGRVSHAEHEVDIVSPYFVPGELGIEMMRRGNQQHGITRIFTNSLASTDAWAAEGGYIRYRERMLDENVQLFELSPRLARDRRHLGPFGRSLGSLHAKCVIIDNKTVFMGSMNLDHRSAVENTEVGLIIDSPDLAAQISSLLDPGSFYRVSRDAEGRTRWTNQGPHGEVTYYADPETTWWQRMLPFLASPFVPEDEL